MKFDYDDLSNLRHYNGTWKLLNAEHAPLILSFLYEAFVKRGVMVAPESELCQILDNVIFQAIDGRKVFTKPADTYLSEWSDESKRWLKRTYRSGSDEPFYDITPASQKAIEFINSLHNYSFVGTESRFRSIIDLLRQITLGTVAQPSEIISDLEEQIKVLSERLENAKRGQIDRLSELEVLDRFQQFEQHARTLLSDFRTVEYNLRDLDKGIRQIIAKWDGSKGELLSEVLENSDGIENSQQGRSVVAFSALLLNPTLQDEVRAMIDKLYELSSIKGINYDHNVKNVYRGWIIGNEHVQRTMGALSKQLKHFIDDKVFLENRRIYELIKGIERNVIDNSLLDNKDFLNSFNNFFIDLPYADINLPFERVMFTPNEKISINSESIEVGTNDSDIDNLLDISSVDRNELIHNIRVFLSDKDEVPLSEIIKEYPLKQGLSELVTYFCVLNDNFDTWEDHDIEEEIIWSAADNPEVMRRTRISRIYIRERG